MSISVERHESLGSLFASLEEAQPPFYFLAGGTDLMVALKSGVLPEGGTWFDISDIMALKIIELRNGSLVIGGGITHAELMNNALVKRYAPGLVQAASNVGSVQIRTRGTLAGNVANGSPAADTVPALFSLGAIVNLRSARGTRSVKIEDYALAPRRTVRQDDELIESISFPAQDGIRGCWLALNQRKALSISKISVAVSAVGTKEKLSFLQIAFGSVGPTVLRTPKAEQILLEQGINPTSLEHACRQVLQEVHPISDIRSTQEYRQAMSSVLLQDALEALFQ